MPHVERVDGGKPTGPRSRKGVETRARLLDAAKQIFEETGFLDARISDIAERASLSHGSFYHYFHSKEQVFREVAVAIEKRLSAPLIDVVLAPSDVSPRERIREAIGRYLANYRAEARIMGVIEQVSRYDDQVHAARMGWHRRSIMQIADSIGDLQRRGSADPTLDPFLAACGLGALTNRFVEMWLVDGVLDNSVDVCAEQLTRIFVNALQLKEEHG